VAPHIAALVPAKTVTFAKISGSGRGTRVEVFCEVPRAYVALASHSGSCDHGCGDQCSRQKF
jgi:hypothetical protein